MVVMINSNPFIIGFVQSRASALSQSDFEDVREHMGFEALFSAVTDPQMRAEITRYLLATNELILSLHTLISHIRYLNRPAKVLGTLLPPKAKRRAKRSKGTQATVWTLRQRFHSHYTRRGSNDQSIEIQQSAVSYTTIPATGLDAFDVSYQMLWLCSCRVWRYSNAYGILQLATLAKRLGFSNAEIKHEVGKDPGQGVIEKAVHDTLMILRPNEKFVFDYDQVRPLVTSFKVYLERMLTAPLMATLPFITMAGQGEFLARRCGYGSMDTKDLNHMFLDTIHCSLQDYLRGGREISSFYVKRSRHLAFFGPLKLTDNPRDQFSPSTSATMPLDATLPESSPVPLDPNLHTFSSHRAAEVVRVAGPVITFVENSATIQQGLFEKNWVNSQAREYADQGKKLHLPEGPHFIWEHCFEILTRTGNSTVLVTTVVEPISGKRRHGQDLSEIL